MMAGGVYPARRVRALALQGSAITAALLIAAPAFGQCTPDPTQANATTTCTGTDADGLVVTTYGTTVAVAAGASVQGNGAPGIAVRLPSDVYGAGVSVNVAGRVDGGDQAGVSLLWQPAASGYTYSSANLAMTVAEGGTVTGTNAVVVGQAGSGYGSAYATIDNAGTLTGTGGIALLASTPGYSAFGSIINRATGTIGAISGSVGSLNNAGTIDGGTRSAIDWGTGYAYYSGDLANTGTIASTSDTATLANLPSGRTLTNSGTIANRGAGPAIAGTGLSITNAAGGRIASAGATAIQATSYLTLTNAGTIDGDVRVDAQNYYGASTIDSSAGTINGNLILGAGNDTLVAGYDGTGLVTGVTGTIDGGDGTDTVRVRFASDATVGIALQLPATFERLSLAPDAGVTATLVDGFAAPSPLRLTGAGTVVNQTTLTGTTQAVQAGDYINGYGLTFINDGTIVTTDASAGNSAVGFFVGNRFTNNGTINAASIGVDFGSQGSFTNTGTITAGGPGVSLFGPSFANSGTIRSTGGTGVVLSGSSGSNWVNSGRIEGASAGASIRSYLVNSGTITSPGTAVLLDYYGVLSNQAGGVISGGSYAINSPGSYGVFQARVGNAGTINGDVVLVSSSYDTYNNNRFFALPGGVLNGNLTLGGGDLLVTELANTGPGAFAGITGTVSASNSLLRYRVRQDASATLTAPAGFSSVGYDLFDNAALTLTGSSTTTLNLAGAGSVDLNATITTTNTPAITVGTVAGAPGEAAPTTAALAITSRGDLTMVHDDASTYPGAAVLLTTYNSADSFTNAGTITVRERTSPAYSRVAAISGGNSVTNSGTISLDGALGVTGAQSFTNTGSIVQVAGGAAATGVSGVGSLTNSGTIDVAGNAVTFGYGYTRSITNSGRIASSADVAIGGDYIPYGLTIANLAGGTIAGGAGNAAIRVAGGTLDNAGTITGSVDLGYSSYGRSYSSGGYIADGGTIAGDLLFGSGNDVLVAMNDATGVSGTVDGGAGDDLFIHARDTSGTVTLGLANVSNFELQGVRALGADTVVTVGAADPLDGDLYLSGDGSIVNDATINGTARTGYYGNGFYTDPASGLLLAAFTNRGSIAGGFSGAVSRFVNSGSMGSADASGPVVSIGQSSAIDFANSGTITAGAYQAAVALTSQTGIDASNTGTITGAVSATAYNYYSDDAPAPLQIAMTNAGTITSVNDGGTAVALTVYAGDQSSGSVSLTNSGTIEATGVGGTAVALGVGGGTPGSASLSLVNSGTIRANGGGMAPPADPYAGAGYPPATMPAAALLVSNDQGASASITNAAGGVIEATGDRSVAVIGYNTGLDITNAGTIRGGAGTTLGGDDALATSIGSDFLAGAIQSVGDVNDRIVNTGSIIGSIALGDGDDRIENRGTIDGNVSLGSGDDTFLQQASATLTGTVDGGEGTDGLVIDATGGGSVNGDQFVNFERFTQIGSGDVTYAGTFRFNTIGVMGGTVTVAAGQTLSSDGPVTVTGSDAGETVNNNGTITGSVDLAGGNDRVVNNGTILGSVLLGSGDDEYVEGVGSRVAGTVDGGTGNDLYTVMLAGDRTGIGQRTGFERLGVAGSGTLSLTLDQDFSGVALAGTGLDVTTAGHRIGAVTGTDAAESFATDGDVASVSLGGGDDRLSLGTTRAVGRYDGGAGNDVLRFTATGPVTLAGVATGFEQVSLAGNALTVTGTLGSAGTPLAFGAGNQQLTVATGGTLAGAIDLGDGDDSFRLAAGGMLNGTVNGGAGNDIATLEMAGDRTLAAGTLTGFETLASEGTGTLSLAGAQNYTLVNAAGSLAVLAGGSLASDVRLGAGNDRLTIAGRFAGSVDGGAGTDTIAVSGGSADAPVAFGSIANVEAFDMTGGFASVSGTAALGNATLSGGRLVGLAGSTIGANQITVGRGATFGSAGTVNANLAIAGTLSPGASPGTMTVNGNVALQAGSVSLFELTPTVSDKLVVNGAVSIAQGSTLQIVPIGTLRPGTSYDLVVASGGISGSYSTVTKPDTLFGFVVQRADRIQLLGQFLGDAGFSPQVTRSIAYANDTLVKQAATSTLFDAVPALLTASGASNARAFAQLTPEAYASASQIGVDNALTLSGAARGAGFAASGDRPRAFTFGQVIGNWHQLSDDARQGVSAAHNRSYGFLGGVGFGDASWSVGAFAGYLNDRQTIDTLGARTKADGVVAGVQGRYTARGFDLTGAVMYDGGQAHTDRALPGGGAASGRYDLHSWIGDASLGYGLAVADDWTLRPHVGVTYVRTTRDGVAEAGGSAFALSVARDRHVAGFADGGLSFARAEASPAPLRPFVSLGLRYQIEGRRADAVAGYAGGDIGLVGLGAQRARLVGTAAGGVAYRLPSGIDLFASVGSQTGRDDHQESVTGGVRLRF